MWPIFTGQNWSEPLKKHITSPDTSSSGSRAARQQSSTAAAAAAEAVRRRTFTLRLCGAVS